MTHSHLEVAVTPLRVFTFPPAWDLPTSGPFGLKLEACLRMLDVPYERVFEGDSRKGPKDTGEFAALADYRELLAGL